MSATELSVKSVTTAISWEYSGLPVSSIRCALCLVDCSETTEGNPSSSDSTVGMVKTHRACGTVVHESCLEKFKASPSGTICPGCKQENPQFSASMNLFASK